MEHVFMKVIELSILAGSMILAILIARMFLKRAPRYMHCLLWLFVAIRLVCPLEIISPFGILPVQSAQGDSTAVQNPGEGGSYGTLSDAESQNRNDSYVSYDAAGLQGADQSGEQISSTETAGGIQTDRGSAVGVKAFAALSRFYTRISSRFWSFVELHTQILLLLWIVGITGVLAYGLVSYLRLYQKIRFAVPGVWKGSLKYGTDHDGQQPQKEMGTFLYKVYYADQIETPFLLGAFRGRIYIPSAWRNQDLTYVIAHERAHLQRKDHLLKPLAFLLLAVYWFQPLVWIAYLLLCRDIEMACDERVIRSLGADSKKDYAAALFQGSVGYKTVTACPVAFAEVGVRQRIKKILNYKRPAFWIMVVAVLICIAVPICFMTQRRSSDDTSVGNAAQGNMAYGDVIKGSATGIDSANGSTLIEDPANGNAAAESESSIDGAVSVTNASLMLAQLDEKMQDLERNIQSMEELKIQTETQLADSRDRLTEAEIQDIEKQLEKYDADIQLMQDQLAQTQEQRSLMALARSTDPELSAVSALGEAWAKAFCWRDGQTLMSFLSDEAIAELTEQGDMMIGSDTGEVSFGWSSPWPWDDQTDFLIQEIDTGTDTMTILYYAETSDPHLTVWVQTLSYVLSGENYVITSQDLNMKEIASAAAYEEAYPEQKINDTRMDYLTNGLGEYLNQNAKQDTNSVYPRLFAPDTAARFLLGLDDSVEIAVNYGENQTAQIADEASVTLSFSDGSQIVLTMVRPYGTDGIWIPQD